MTSPVTEPLTPEQYGRRLAKDAPPLTPEQIRAAARILASVPEKNDQETGGDGREVRRGDGM